MRTRSSIIFLVVLFFLSSAALVHAQAGKAEVTGEVRDQNGAVVTQARVVVTDVATGQTYSSTVTDTGNYTIISLKPGTYNVAVEANGFKRLVREAVHLATGERVRLDMVLEPGAVAERWTISQAASLLRKESGSLGQVVQNRKIVDIPLNGRNFLSLVTLSPGVAQPPPTTTGPSFPRINGGPPGTNENFFHRIFFSETKPGQRGFFPVVEGIQEIKEEVNNPPA